MKKILPITAALAVLLIVGISPTIIAGSNSLQKTSVTLFPYGDITSRSQPLLIENSGYVTVMYYIYDESSRMHSGIFAVEPNSTQIINPNFSSPAEVMQLIAYDFSTNQPISNLINETIMGQTISMINITVTSESCYHYGNCVDNIKVDVATNGGPQFIGILTDNRGDIAKIVNNTGTVQTGGGRGESAQVYIIAGGTRSNSLSITF